MAAFTAAPVANPKSSNLRPLNNKESRNLRRPHLLNSPPGVCFVPMAEAHSLCLNGSRPAPAPPSPNARQQRTVDRGGARSTRLLLTQRTLGAAALRSSCSANSLVGDQRYPSVGRGRRRPSQHDVVRSSVISDDQPTWPIFPRFRHIRTVCCGRVEQQSQRKRQIRRLRKMIILVLPKSDAGCHWISARSEIWIGST